MTSTASSDDFEIIDHQDTKLSPEDLLKLQAWLQPTDYTADSSEFHRHLSSQAPETGLWICDTSRFQQWHQSDDHGSLWVKGVPGSGKSVIASSIVDHLKSKEDVPVLYFFFRYIIATNRKPRNLIQDFIAQLLPYSPQLQSRLQTYIDSELEHISDDRLWDFLLLGLISVERAYCVVDAMDEMDSNESFLGHLNALATLRPASIKLFMTSRPKQYLQSALRDASIVHISLEDELVGKDIATFVTHRLRGFMSDDQNRQLRKTLETTICERSRGLFLYARLLVDQITPKLQAGVELDVEHLTINLPVGLEEMYNSMLYQNSVDQKVDTAVQVFLLEFVTHSCRPLRLNELANVLASEFEPHHLPATAKNVARTACAPLLEILEDETVQVIHHSFTEFLLDGERSKVHGSVPQFPSLNPFLVHKKLTTICLRYLQSGVLRNHEVQQTAKNTDRYARHNSDNDDSDDDCAEKDANIGAPFDYQESKLKYPFLEYAVRNWAFHCHSHDSDDEDFVNVVSSFLDDNSLDFQQWIKLEWTPKQIQDASPTSLHVAAFAGMTIYAARLLNEASSVNALDPDDRTPLHWACRRGHTEIVTLLLKKGAEADAHDCRGITPIHEAALRNHAKIVELLLEAGVDPMTPKTKQNHGGRLKGGERSTVGETAVEYACQNAYLQTVKAMTPYLKPEGLQIALGRACRQRAVEIVEYLLNNSSVSPDGKFDGGTPLYIAILARSVSCVELLLKAGADPLIKCEYTPNFRINGMSRYPRNGTRTPIQALFVEGSSQEDQKMLKQFLTLLIRAGADINEVDSSGATPLLSLFASRIGARQETIVTLLQYGASIDAVDLEGNTVFLRCLLHKKDLAIIKTLLEHGANIQARNSCGKSALHQIISHPHGGLTTSLNEIIAFLVAEGARADLKDINGRSALQEAILSRQCNFETFKLLLETCGGDGAKTCIQFLGSRANIEETKLLLDLLLEYGVDLEMRNMLGRTPILQDMRQTHAIEALRQAGADVHATDKRGRGMLHNLVNITGNYPDLASFKKYVDWGLDPLCIDAEGNTLLHLAAANFQGSLREVDFLEHLLACGLEINRQNARGETPLQLATGWTQLNGSSREKKKTFLEALKQLGKSEELDINAQDMTGLAAIHLATLKSEVELSHLLAAGAGHSLLTNEKRSILHLACRARKSNVVGFIVEHCKGLVDLQDADGRTALHDACTSGRPESVFCLLRAGASVHLIDEKGQTPLHSCAAFPMEHALWNLLRNRKHPGSAIQYDRFRPVSDNDHRHEPWYVARYSQNPPFSTYDTCRIGGIVDMLLEAGANPLARDKKKWFPLDLAIANDCHDMIERLAFTEEVVVQAWAEKEERRMDLSLFLKLKTSPGKLSMAKLDEATKIEVLKMPRKWIPLLDYSSLCTWVAKNTEILSENHSVAKIAKEAATHGLIELLVALGPLAALTDDAAIAKLLYEEECKNQSYVTIDDWAPVLHIACYQKTYNLPVIKTLITGCNANPTARALLQPSPYQHNSQSSSGTTALHVLAGSNVSWSPQAIEYLLSTCSSIDINAVNSVGETPLHFASVGDIRDNIQTAESTFAPQIVSLLLLHGANPNTLSSSGLSPLHKACSSQFASTSTPIVRSLLEYGADININPACSPIFSAIFAQNLKALEILLDLGATPNSIDTTHDFLLDYRVKIPNLKCTALFCACFASLMNQSFQKSMPLIKLLLERGADWGAWLQGTAGKGERLIHYVFEYGVEDLVNLFLDFLPMAFLYQDRDKDKVEQRVVEEAESAPAVAIDWETLDGQGNTVLLAAARWIECPRGYRYKHWDSPLIQPITRLLDASDINTFATNFAGQNVLHLLCLNADIETSTILSVLSHPTFVIPSNSQRLIHQIDKSGHTPLHYALQVLRPDVIERLIDLGGDFWALDPKGRGPGHWIAAQCLEIDEKPRGNHLRREHRREWYEGLDRLLLLWLKAGFENIDKKDNEGNPPLFLYLNSGARSDDNRRYWPDDPPARSSDPDYSRYPACHVENMDKYFGAREGREEADFSTTNNKGETALHVIARRKFGEEEHEKALFGWFVKKGVDPLQEDAEGRSSLDILAACGKAEVLAMFERGGGEEPKEKGKGKRR